MRNGNGQRHGLRFEPRSRAPILTASSLPVLLPVPGRDREALLCLESEARACRIGILLHNCCDSPGRSSETRKAQKAGECPCPTSLLSEGPSQDAKQRTCSMSETKGTHTHHRIFFFWSAGGDFFGVSLIDTHSSTSAQNLSTKAGPALCRNGPRC